MDYKIETKPTLWEIVISHGSYSDADQSNFFISANDREEAWFQFKRFWESEYEQHTCNRPILILLASDNNRVDTFIPSDWNSRLRMFKERTINEPDLDTDDGYANAVQIYQVKVIRFKK